MNDVHIAVAVYLIGAAIGLARTDAAWPVRVLVSLVWPVGPLAFVVVIVGLVVVAGLAFPLVGVGLVAAVALALALLWT